MKENECRKIKSATALPIDRLFMSLYIFLCATSRRFICRQIDEVISFTGDAAESCSAQVQAFKVHRHCGRFETAPSVQSYRAPIYIHVYSNSCI